MLAVIVGRAIYQSAGLILSQSKHKIGRQLIGSVLLVPKNRDIEQIEQSVPYLVGGNIQELPDHRIAVRNSTPRHVLWYGLLDDIQQLIANGYLPPFVPGICNAVTFAGLKNQLTRQPKRTEKSL